MRLSKIKALVTILLVLMSIMLTSCTSINQGDISTSGSANEVNENNNLIVHFIDVGQADSILIELPNGETSLIDGGNRQDAELVVNYIKDLNIKEIDYLIATHPHEDHIGGLPDVVREFKIGKIYMPRKSSNTKIYENLLKEIKNKGLKITTARGGQKIIDVDKLKFTIIAPNSKKYDETNEYSIVNKLTYKNTSFLFTGDAEKDSEDEMLKLGYDLSADVLKVGHHGGRTSTNVEFLKRVNPKYAVISAGKGNDYGHPHKEVIERLQDRNIVIFRTDVHGTIKAISDGDNIKFNKNVKSDNYQNEDVVKNNNDIYYIGNKRSKVYHSPSCKNLPKLENRIIFKTKEEAENKGYRPHKTCVD
ncbi:MBL fold metallo-hydrolase [Caldisalinibacter kiritimatiensis]|uniref:Late competence protein ComEC, DNA transport n=1 Tax=Caldisalinibacter kiritimatiensis TaxID=1304284 RepID=R1AW07_9FIRM|nr:MBL fold metallo-hydrolase [Caldisalinibacter kiritimatiensis]EOD01363.1 Late competence protein ComEC, DNA transport [Caldisalinibacter kiritimatiensis]